MLQASSYSKTDPIKNLQLGLGIELSVLPPYLYTMWSIRAQSEGASVAAVEAANTIRSVAYEEMLHAGIVANLLNALGALPDVTKHLMRYPGTLPGFVTTGPHAFDVGLCPLSKDTIKTFMRIELPEFDTRSPQDVATAGWITIPEFYNALKGQLKEMDPGAFHHGRQLPPTDNPGPGRMINVVDLATALEGIDVIVDQGEGHKPKDPTDPPTDDDDHEVSHFVQFQTIGMYLTQKLIPKRDLHPVIANPDASMYGATQQAANRAFNAVYSELLDSLQASLSIGSPKVFGSSTTLMKNLAHAAARLRTLGNVPGTKFVAGPTFEYIPREER